MSDSGKQSPLGANAASALLLNTGLNINAVTSGYTGVSNDYTTYTPGTVITTTCLNKLTLAINAGYLAYLASTIDAATYNNLISIGAGTIPALGNSKSSKYTYTGAVNTGDPTSLAAQSASWLPYNNTNSVTQWGYIRLLALQAWNEFNYNGYPAGSVEYKDFCSSFSAGKSFIDSSNASINTISNSKTFLEGTYSNMDDLISADISGVSLATNVFGQDLIASGTVLDLTKLSSLGLPSVLLQTLSKYNAITQSLGLALVAAELMPNEISAILASTVTPTMLQEQKIYGAFLIIVGIDLRDILIPLNCKTMGLTSLADLLNPMKLFPNSYQSLTVPIYNATLVPTNSKTYYPIYSGSGINTTIASPSINAIVGSQIPSNSPLVTNASSEIIQALPTGFGSYLFGILPSDIATACGALNVSLRQIKNISSAPIEKFAQVVANTETTRGLDLIGGTSVPVDSTLIDQANAIVALGSGANGTYTISDLFGCMSGLPYDWKSIQSLILEIQTPTLVSIYDSLYTAVTTSAGIPVIQGYIDQANAEIANILLTRAASSKTLNTLYDITGTQLTIEQQARFAAFVPVPIPKDITLSQYPSTLFFFVDSITSYALDTIPHMTAQTIEAISDWTTVGGQSIVGLMRTARNKARLIAAGIVLDDTIPDTVNSEIQKKLLANGTVCGVNGVEINGNVFTLPSVVNVGGGSTPSGYYDPTSASYMLTSSTNSTTSLGDLANANNCTCDAILKTGPLVPVGPASILDKGQVDEPGSLAGSEYQNLIPPNLSLAFTSKVLTPSTYNVADAIVQVTTCNCDCWIP